MERFLKIQQEGTKLLEPVLFNRIKEIQSYYKENREDILDSLKITVETLCKKARTLQQNKKKQAIGFFSISCLKQCIYTGQYGVRLDLYDKDFYLDQCEVCEYWQMDFLYHFFEADMKYFKSHLDGIIVQLQEYEEKEFASWYITHYHKIAELFFRNRIKDLEPCFKNIEKTQMFTITYGGYMDSQSILGSQ